MILRTMLLASALTFGAAAYAQDPEATQNGQKIDQRGTRAPVGTPLDRSKQPESGDPDKTQAGQPVLNRNEQRARTPVESQRANVPPRSGSGDPDKTHNNKKILNN